MEPSGRQLTINISTKTILKVILIAGLLALLYLLRDVVLILIVSIIIATALNPWINALQRRRVPRILATAFIYLAFFGSFIIVLVLMIPPIANEISEITKNFPVYYNRILADFTRFREYSMQQGLLNNLQAALQSLQANMGQTTAGVFNAVASVFGGFLSFIGIVVITFYMLLEENALKKFIRSLTPAKYQPYVFQLMNRAQERLRLWLRGQLILCLIIGVLAFIGLRILGVKFSLVLGLWAGLTEFIPYLGPFLGAVPAVFIALTAGSFLKAVLVIAWYVVIQQLENHLLVPKVMEKTVGLNPLVVIIVMLVGAKLAGVVGIMLAVPFALIIKAFAEDFMALKEEEHNTLEP
ncbi:MAG: AI-2E family transporter [Patescibacteria group bacterium]|nr:AI-2E family transporter [Patescibacteria group bacterium]MDD5716147.1 AI-2E family transporter [Patescibacteria group bacterium]